MVNSKGPSLNAAPSCIPRIVARIPGPAGAHSPVVFSASRSKTDVVSALQVVASAMGRPPLLATVVMAQPDSTPGELVASLPALRRDNDLRSVIVFRQGECPPDLEAAFGYPSALAPRRDQPCKRARFGSNCSLRTPLGDRLTRIWRDDLHCSAPMALSLTHICCLTTPNGFHQTLPLQRPEISLVTNRCNGLVAVGFRARSIARCRAPPPWG